MGTDIHLIVQRRNENGQWYRVMPPTDYNETDPWLANNYQNAITSERRNDSHSMDSYYIRKYETSWYSDRNYRLFAVLADVRNGYGFAGTPTGIPITPIATPRGLPTDLNVPSQVYDEDGEEIGGVDAFDFGDHSFSYLTLTEILSYGWDDINMHCGVISFDEYVQRQRENNHEQPDTWSGDISGPGVRVIEESEARMMLEKIGNGTVVDPNIKWYVRIWWGHPIRNSMGTFLTRVVPALQKLDDNTDNVRIVFGFDS